MSDWRTEQGEYVAKILEPIGYRVSKTVDDDGDVSLIVSWYASAPAHARAQFLFEEDGSHAAFYSFAYQGAGGVGMHLLTGVNADNGAHQFAYDCMNWKRMVEAFRSETRR